MEERAAGHLRGRIMMKKGEMFPTRAGGQSLMTDDQTKDKI